MEDRLKYDLLPEAGKLKMPVLMIVGEKDESTPSDHMQKLYDVIPGKKEFHIIKGAPHTFREKEHLEETISEISKRGLRVLALAQKKISAKKVGGDDVKDLTFVGFFGLQDALPP